MPSIVTRNLQPSVDAFSGDLDQMNLSNHPPSGNMTPKASSFIASSFSSSSSSSNAPPLLSQSSVSNIPFSTTSNASYSANLSGNGMNSSGHGSAHGSVSGVGGSVRSQGSIPMMGFKQDYSDPSRYDGSGIDPMRAQTEGMRRGWNDNETGTETESEIDFGQNTGASGDHIILSTSTMLYSMLLSLYFSIFLSFLYIYCYPFTPPFLLHFYACLLVSSYVHVFIISFSLILLQGPV